MQTVAPAKMIRHIKIVSVRVVSSWVRDHNALKLRVVLLTQMIFRTAETTMEAQDHHQQDHHQQDHHQQEAVHLPDNDQVHLHLPEAEE